MNTRLFLFACIAGLALIFSGCHKNDDNNEGIIPLPPVYKAFQDKYPDARDAFFDIEGMYYYVDFLNKNVPTTAWFTDQGVWTMDKAKIPFSQLPADVMAAFKEGPYAQLAVDDSYVINHVDMAVIYKIEAGTDDNEMDLYYSVSGELIKAIQNNGNDDSPSNYPKDITDL